MTKAEAAQALRERAYARGITAARSQEEFDDDDRLIDAYVSCHRCETLHLPRPVRDRLIHQARDVGQVSELVQAWYEAAHR